MESQSYYQIKQVVQVNHVENAMLSDYKNNMLYKKSGRSQGNVIVQFTMRKLYLTLIQQILGVMQKTQPS